MLFRHGSLVIDIPDDWRDESTLLFSSPSRRPALMTTQPVAPTGEAITVRFTAGGDTTPRQLLEQQVAILEQLDPTLRKISEEPFRSGLGEGLLVEHEMRAAEIPVRQLIYCVKVGPVLIVAIASVPSADIERARPQLKKIIASLRAER